MFIYFEEEKILANADALVSIMPHTFADAPYDYLEFRFSDQTNVRMTVNEPKEIDDTIAVIADGIARKALIVRF